MSANRLFVVNIADNDRTSFSESPDQSQPNFTESVNQMVWFVEYCLTSS